MTAQLTPREQARLEGVPEDQLVYYPDTLDNHSTGLRAVSDTVTEVEEFTLHNPSSTESDPDSRIFEGAAQLEKIRDYARYRKVGPMSLLVATLARLSCQIAPEITVDVGKGPGSLNLFAAIVGPSGSEKSRTLKTAGEVLEVLNPSAEYEQRTPGSGEGIIGAYAPKLQFHGKGQEPTEAPGAVSILWEEAEIMNLTALKSRKGATLQGFLTKLFAAEFLNVSNKDGGPTIPDGSYRASLLLGVQPGRAEPLLADADQGFPQRFIWVETRDRSRLRGHEYPPVNPVSVKIPNYENGIIQGCATAKRITREATDNGLIDGDFQGLDAHANFARAKVAALLAIIREHSEMTEDDWLRAGRIIQASDRARQTCINYKDEAAATAKEIKDKQSDEEERRLVAEIRSKIVAFLGNEKNRGNWVNQSLVKNNMPSARFRGDEFQVALVGLTESGAVQNREHPKYPRTIQYQLTPR